MKAFFLLIALPLIYANTNCSSGKTCATCTSLGGCGWCSATQQCLKGAVSGPEGSYCIGGYWNYGLNGCPVCGDYDTCTSCSTNPNCCWNSAFSLCSPLNSVATCSQNCPCSQYTSCSACNADGGGCAWCPILQTLDEGCIESATFQTECTVQAPNVCPCDSLSCSGCLENDNCVWCSDSHSCADFGTSCTPVASCSAYCDLFSSCETCSQAFGCGWCNASSSCVNLARSLCEIDTTCNFCESARTCSDCINNPSCNWCGDSVGYCTPAGSSSCALTHTCPPPPSTSHFSAGSFVGGMFLCAGIAVIGAIGFVFYRRRKATASYEAVH